MKQTTVEIITPEKLFYKSEAVDFAVIPGYSGELGVLPGHMEVLALLVPGEVRLTIGNETLRYMIAAGFAQVGPESVRVFTTMVKQRT